MKEILAGAELHGFGRVRARSGSAISVLFRRAVADEVVLAGMYMQRLSVGNVSPMCHTILWSRVKTVD